MIHYTIVFNLACEQSERLCSDMIEPDTIYTPQETAKLLKISPSTFKRLLKKGLIRANKVGGQYRILGHEILRLVSPKVDKKATGLYQKIKRKTIKFLEE